MADIKAQKLIYHLTDLDNIPSILAHGLLPRASLTNFSDVADPEILNSRRAIGLEQKVPFHFFANNPFDGRVQADNPDKKFVLISVHRDLAAARNWEVMPSHPLGNQAPQLLPYQQGFEAINWVKMNERDYSDQESKNACMAECLSPGTVTSDMFFKFFVACNDAQATLSGYLRQGGVNKEITVNAGMFPRTR